VAGFNRLKRGFMNNTYLMTMYNNLVHYVTTGDETSTKLAVKIDGSVVYIPLYERAPNKKEAQLRYNGKTYCIGKTIPYIYFMTTNDSYSLNDYVYTPTTGYMVNVSSKGIVKTKMKCNWYHKIVYSNELSCYIAVGRVRDIRGSRIYSYSGVFIAVSRDGYTWKEHDVSNYFSVPKVFRWYSSRTPVDSCPYYYVRPDYTTQKAFYSDTDWTSYWCGWRSESGGSSGLIDTDITEDEALVQLSVIPSERKVRIAYAGTLRNGSHSRAIMTEDYKLSAELNLSPLVHTYVLESKETSYRLVNEYLMYRTSDYTNILFYRNDFPTNSISSTYRFIWYRIKQRYEIKNTLCVDPASNYIYMTGKTYRINYLPTPDSDIQVVFPLTEVSVSQIWEIHKNSGYKTFANGSRFYLGLDRNGTLLAPSYGASPVIYNNTDHFWESIELATVNGVQGVLVHRLTDFDNMDKASAWESKFMEDSDVTFNEIISYTEFI